ncbi:MAG: ABC transporter substrate-binding protein [Oscillospiraceae bacterium]|jgi:NitT/TauT family transport system substrate-binding protein|nr:ABC transporter substrate-binding protein [Oscillospiraceae bacterium]
MKRPSNILLAALSLLLIFALTACNSSETEPTTSPTDTPAADATENTIAPEAPEVPALEQTTFKIGHLNSTAHLLAFVAQEEGYFAEEGLDAELLLFASSGEMVQGLNSGSLDAALIGSVPTITFQSQDNPITIFGGAMTNGHGYVIKPEFTDGLESWDITILRGRNVATVKNSIQDLQLLLLLDEAGLVPGVDVNVVYFDSQKDAYNALQGAEIDAASVYSPYASLAQSQGYDVVFYCSEIEHFHNQPCCRQVAPTQALLDKPNTYTAFERALIKAYKFSQENRDDTIADVKKYIDIEDELLRVEIYGGYSFSVPDPDRIATTELKEQIVDFGYTTDYDIDALYNVDIYRAALYSILEEYPDDTVYKELEIRFEENN